MIRELGLSESRKRELGGFRELESDKLACMADVARASVTASIKHSEFNPGVDIADRMRRFEPPW
jgi:hypothetical protein